MEATRIRYSQELQEAVAQHGPLSTYDDAVREAVAVLAGRFAEVRLSPAWAAPDEGAAVGEDHATLHLTVLPLRFANPRGLTRFLRHELGHVADILDSAFGYGNVPEDLAATPTLRRRFKLLWACCVDGRTARLGGSPLHTLEEYEVEFLRQFPGLTDGAAGVAVRRLWDGQRPCYHCLMRMAADLAAQPAASLSVAGPAVVDEARYATERT
ncbi:MAG: hypothetical protein ACYDAB_05520 [bacterium]